MLATTDTDSVLYCLLDANKHIMQMVNESKRLQSINYYSLFGILTGYLDSSQFCFSSEIIDAQTSMTYYIFRYYAPNIGRWINRDPIQENGGIHIYVFCQNNPNMFIEHLGKSFWDYIPFVSTAIHLINRPKGIHPSDYIAHPPSFEDCCKFNLTSFPDEDPEQRCIDDINNQFNRYWRAYVNWGISSDFIEELAGGIITKYMTKKMLQVYLGSAFMIDAFGDGALVIYNIFSMYNVAKEIMEEKCKCKYY